MKIFSPFKFNNTKVFNQNFLTYFSLNQKTVPPRWVLEPTDKAFAQGSNAKVECKADGFPKPTVTWKMAVGE